MTCKLHTNISIFGIHMVIHKLTINKKIKKIKKIDNAQTV